MRKILSVIIVVMLIAGLASPALAVNNADLEAAVNRTAAFMLENVPNPQVDSVGGEWAVIGLARSGFNVPDSYFENYFQTVQRHLRDNNGVLHERRLTDYSRVILALTASGFDPRDVGGFDLTLPLGDFERTIWQGVNGPIWALIALDSANFVIPVNPNAQTQSTRELFIAEILRRQTPDGGWNLTAGATGPVAANEIGDPGLTGMALQAFSRYQDMPDVRAATDRALAFLSGIQTTQGGFSSTFSGSSSDVESAVQVLVALTELGISLRDPRFVKNGYSVLDSIMSYGLPDGSFMHSRDGSGNNQMSTEQAFYGLVAAQRAAQGRNSLYNMTDVTLRGGDAGIQTPEVPQTPGSFGLPGRNSNVNLMPVVNPGRTFADVSGHANRAAIEALASRSIISGMTETTFAPDATMTRAEFAAIVTRGLGLPPQQVSTVFSDVPAGAWFAVPVATAQHFGIVSGTSPTTFNPGGTITRQEAAVMVARAADLAGMSVEMSDTEIINTLAIFGDSRAAATWARSALAFVYSEGILDDSEFYILPTEAITRAEIAEMLHRLLSLADLL